MNLNELTEVQISKLLSVKSSNTYDLAEKQAVSNYKKASVLVPFVRKNNEWHILFIRRATSDRDRHSGQVGFVGGKAESYDYSKTDTALRETQEEIGLEASRIHVLGQLGAHYSLSHFEITPIVASVQLPKSLTLDPNEVSHTFTLPLSWLADEKNYVIKQRQPPEINETIAVVYFKEYEGELLWGATARIVLSLIKSLRQ